MTTRLGRALKLYRASKDLSMDDVAKQIEVGTSFLSLLENGKRDASKHIQLAIMSWLLEEEDKP